MADVTAQPDFWQYDPFKVSVSFAGITLSGFADGTFVEVERTRDAFEVLVGTTGAVARARTRDDTGKATFTLLAQSPCAQRLYAVAQGDALTWQGAGRFMLKDGNIDGALTAVSVEAWLSRSPKVTRGKQGDVVQFELRLADIETFAAAAGN